MVRIRSSLLAVRMAAGVLGAGVSSGAMALTIFACEPEWASLASELAPQASIVSATHARQDPHYIEARPSLIAQLRRADLAICTGAELEAGWLPVLQQRAGNPSVQNGQPGMLFVSELVALIDKQPEATRAQGDVHPTGNPHVHLDPVRVAQIAQALSKRLQAIDPDGAKGYQERHDAWAQQWTQHQVRWAQEAVPLKGRAVVAQHSSFAYLWQWLGMHQTLDLEPKPGLPPTPSHLSSLVVEVRQQKPVAIVQTLYQDQAPVRWLHERTDVPWLSLPSTVTQDGPSTSLSALLDTLIQQLVELAEPTKR